MKKHIFSLFVVALVVFAGRDAFALNCNQSQNYGQSSQCFTQVKVAADETTLVSQGHVLVFDVSEGTANGFAYQSELSDASLDHVLVAGVVQDSTVASGRTTNVQVRGQAQLRIVGSVASGEALYVSATEGRAGVVGASGAKPIAFALESGTTGQVIDAYLTIV